MKTCTKCKVEKPFQEFCSNKLRKDGLNYYCKTCVSHINKTYKKKWREDGGLKKETQNIESNPMRKLKKRIKTLVAISITKVGYFKKTKVFEILGADFEVVKKHLELQFQPGMSWENHGDWHIDHIIPMACADSEEKALALNHYKNLQPLWANENLRKGAKLDYTMK